MLEFQVPLPECGETQGPIVAYTTSMHNPNTSIRNHEALYATKDVAHTKFRPSRRN
jgi:hypothetical protein